MEFWILLWKAVFIFAVLIFSCMAVWVTIGGYFDLKKLFRKLNDIDDEEEEANED
jgi:hypothetical protein